MSDQHKLKSQMNYDPETGVLTWLRGQRAGKTAGCFADGYINIAFDGKNYRAHVLAWLWMTGAWPTHEVDHENRDGTDNKWKNLRAATHKQNLENLDPSSACTSGRRGVCWKRREKRWCAHITHNYKTREIGCFADLVDAVAARIRAERGLFTHAQACKVAS